MLGTISTQANGAISSADMAAGNPVQDSRILVSDENWFAEMLQKLYAKPGLELHLVSGMDERSCHRYAAGTVKPLAYFLRKLLRGQHGGRFLEYLMDGSDADWWRELKVARALCAQYRIERRPE